MTKSRSKWKKRKPGKGKGEIRSKNKKAEIESSKRFLSLNIVTSCPRTVVLWDLFEV